MVVTESAPVAQRVAAALVGRPAFWVLLVAAVASWPALWSWRHPLPAPPGVLGALPAFELLDEQGRVFGTRELAGHVWVGSWLATQGGVSAVAHLSRIQDRGRQLAPVLHLVSFSADPGRDTPGRLLALAHRNHVSPRLWSFLGGPTGSLRDAVAQAARHPAAAGSASASAPSEIFLVDRTGRLRGCYDPAAPDVEERVLADAAHLVNRPDEDAPR